MQWLAFLSSVRTGGLGFAKSDTMLPHLATAASVHDKRLLFQIQCCGNITNSSHASANRPSAGHNKGYGWGWAHHGRVNGRSVINSLTLEANKLRG